MTIDHEPQEIVRYSVIVERSGLACCIIGKNEVSTPCLELMPPTLRTVGTYVSVLLRQCLMYPTGSPNEPVGSSGSVPGPV